MLKHRANCRALIGGNFAPSVSLFSPESATMSNILMDNQICEDVAHSGNRQGLLLKDAFKFN